jgi:hypothetical protein
MKHFLFSSALAVSVWFTVASVQSQTNLPAAAPAVPVAANQAVPGLEKHIKPVLAALKLTDAAQSAKVHDFLAAQLQALQVWHQANDAHIKPLWNQFSKARSAQNVTNSAAALAQLDAIYATFKPQHDQFLANLGTVLTPAQVETVKDILTVNKVSVTYHVYLQIFPTMTDAQKAVVLADLKAAREQAIDCESMVEKSEFFKKYKIQIEDVYLTAQGFNPKQARKDFANQSKAAAE